MEAKDKAGSPNHGDGDGDGNYECPLCGSDELLLMNYDKAQCYACGNIFALEE